MTKAKSRAQRRAAQRASKFHGITLSDGSKQPMRITGRARKSPVQEDPRAVTLKSRERQTGLTGAAALHPLNETAMGKCILHITSGDDQAQLAGAWLAMCAVRRNYLSRYVGHTGSPQGAAIAMVPDRMETDQSAMVDLRTPEERVARDKIAWAEWEAKIDAITVPQLKSALRGAVFGFMGEARLWADQQPTGLGRCAVVALRQIAAK